MNSARQFIVPPLYSTREYHIHVFAPFKPCLRLAALTHGFSPVFCSHWLSFASFVILDLLLVTIQPHRYTRDPTSFCHKLRPLYKLEDNWTRSSFHKQGRPADTPDLTRPDQTRPAWTKQDCKYDIYANTIMARYTWGTRLLTNVYMCSEYDMVFVLSCL